MDMFDLKWATFFARFFACALGSSLIYQVYRYWINGVAYTKNAESQNKVAIITGASSGIGKEVAYGLAKRGLHVVMACRDMKNGQRSQEEIIAKTGNQNVKCMHLDLSSFQSVRAFAEEFLRTGSRLDILINNANVLRIKRQLTDDNLEPNIGINYFGHFLLTMLLIKRMSETTPSRIINITNWLHRCVEIDQSDLMGERDFCGFMAYARSTLANAHFTLALTERIENTGITCNCVHPGISFARFVEKQDFSPKWKFTKKLALFLANLLCKTDKACASSIIYAAVDVSCQNISGMYLSNLEIENYGANMENTYLTEWLWKRSEQITGEKLCDLPNDFKFLKKTAKYQ